ncbi:MAG: hypothetical protein OXN27_05215 [Candidatus Poribacteria bacterium]|nr:hypothetical protein [Candidatus Poribacteria bacterium]
MKNHIFVLFLFLLLVPFLASAGVPDATIPFDCPNMPNAKFQFHFTREIIALATTTTPFNTVDDLYIRIYGYDAGVFNKLAWYYDEKLKAKNWHSIQETNNHHLYMLAKTDGQNRRSDNTIAGIFAIVKNDENISLLNIVGSVPLQQTNRLLENLSELGIETPELKSLGELVLPKSEETSEEAVERTLLNMVGSVPLQQTDRLLVNLGKLGTEKTVKRMPLPTIFRVTGNTSTVNGQTTYKKTFNLSSIQTYTESHQGHWSYRGHPIESIQIRSTGKKQVARISDGLKSGSEDITDLLDSLLSKNGSADTPKFMVNTSERSVTISAGGMLDDTQPMMLAKSFRTRKGDPIHEIVIRGTEANTVRKALEKGPEEIEAAVKELPNAVPTFEKVDLVVEDKGLQRTAIITVVDKPIDPRFYMDGAPQLGFNRVTGWEIGTRIESGFRRQKENSMSFGFGISSSPESIGDDNSKLFAQIGYGLSNKQIYYRAGGSVVWDEPSSWHLGVTAQLHRSTDIITPNFLSHYDGGGTDALRVFGMRDPLNYYLRQGIEIGLEWKPVMPTHSFKLSLLGETHDSLEKSTDWHFFNWRSKSKAPENPVITPGRMRSVMFQYDLSTRRNHLGWHNTFSVEHGNATFGSDFDFTRYQLHLRYAHPLRGHRIRTRAIGSFSNASLPIQRQFVIGGPGLLNGYSFYAVAGDRGYLFNIEYFFYLPQLFTWGSQQFNFDFNLFLIFFFDAGQAWNIADETRTLAPKSDAGIGFQFGETDSFLRFNVAKAFESEQGVRFNTVWFYSF